MEASFCITSLLSFQLNRLRFISKEKNDDQNDIFKTRISNEEMRLNFKAHCRPL